MQEGSALILSPFATYPLDAGQRKRAFQTTKLLKDIGFRITFLHYAFETRWYWAHNEEDDQVMREQWGDVIHFYAHKGVGIPPLDGVKHGLDEWWDKSLEPFLENLFRKRRFDLLVVHNIWLSKAFEFCPNSTVKALEAHDIFSARAQEFIATGTSPEFFYCSEEDEVFGLNRADILLAIKEEDANWYRQQTLKDGLSIITLPYVDPEEADSGLRLSEKGDYRHSEKVVFGMIGSDIHFNRVAIQELLNHLSAVVSETYAPLEVSLAGSICRSIQGWGSLIHKMGYVDSVDDFYRNVDVVLVPMMHGTGVKIKSIEAIHYRKPVLFTEHSAQGTYHPGQHFGGLTEMARMMASMALHRPSLEPLLKETNEAIERLYQEQQKNAEALKLEVRKRRRGFLQFSVLRTINGEPDFLGLVLDMLAYKQISGWLRPMGLVTDEETLQWISDVAGDPIHTITSPTELQVALSRASVVTVHAEQRALIDLLIDQDSGVDVLVNCRNLSPVEIKTFSENYRSKAHLSLAITPSHLPWVMSMRLHHNVIAMPCLADRISWDPHLPMKALVDQMVALEVIAEHAAESVAISYSNEVKTLSVMGTLDCSLAAKICQSLLIDGSQDIQEAWIDMSDPNLGDITFSNCIALQLLCDTCKLMKINQHLKISEGHVVDINFDLNRCWDEFKHEVLLLGSS